MFLFSEAVGLPTTLSCQVLPFIDKYIDFVINVQPTLSFTKEDIILVLV